MLYLCGQEGGWDEGGLVNGRERGPRAFVFFPLGNCLPGGRLVTAKENMDKMGGASTKQRDGFIVDKGVGGV